MPVLRDAAHEHSGLLLLQETSPPSEPRTCQLEGLPPMSAWPEPSTRSGTLYQAGARSDRRRSAQSYRVSRDPGDGWDAKTVGATRANSCHTRKFKQKQRLGIARGSLAGRYREARGASTDVTVVRLLNFATFVGAPVASKIGCVSTCREMERNEYEPMRDFYKQLREFYRGSTKIRASEARATSTNLSLPQRGISRQATRVARKPTSLGGAIAAYSGTQGSRRGVGRPETLKSE